MVSYKDLEDETLLSVASYTFMFHLNMPDILDNQIFAYNKAYCSRYQNQFTAILVGDSNPSEKLYNYIMDRTGRNQ